MEHIAALLLVVACPGGSNPCHEVETPQSIYETVEECEENLAASINASLARQPVYGQCIRVDPAFEDDYLALVWDVGPDGILDAVLTLPDTPGEIMVADGRGRKDSLSQ